MSNKPNKYEQMATIAKANMEGDGKVAEPELRPERKAKAPPAQTPRYTNPDYMQLKVYVPKKMKTAAARKWEDSGGGDMSGLVEHLLNQFLST